MDFNILRGYQQKGVLEIRTEIQRGIRRILYQLPTGGGKTVLSSYLAYQTSAKKKRFYFVVHRDELVVQASDTFEEFGIPHGIIAPGHSPTDDLVQVASVFTLAKRLATVPVPAVVAWDEAHHSAAGSWKKCDAAFSGAISIGVTATPERTDGAGLDDNFDHMILGPTIKELTAMGSLCKFDHFAPPSVMDLSTVRKSGRDFNRQALGDAVDKPKIIGDAVDHYLRLARGKRAVVFCANVSHSQHTAEQFRKAGLRAAHIDGANYHQRVAAIKDFRNGKLDVICNCDIVSEGFDLPAIEVVILLRPTESLVLYMQQVGRGLRPFAGKDRALILDHAGNINRHGMVDDDRMWSLKGYTERRKNEKAAENDIRVRRCPECHVVHRFSDVCSACGYQYAAGDRVLQKVAGELVPVDPEKFKMAKNNRERQMKIWLATSLADLLKVEAEYGHRSGWALHAWKHHRMNVAARAAERAGPDLFSNQQELS